MTGNGRTRFRTRPLGGAMAFLAGAVFLAACNAGAGASPSSPPAATSAPGTAAAGVTLTLSQNATVGGFVAGRGGMSLYVFANDTAGTSACTGACATNWPPLTVASASDVTAGAGVTGAVGTIQRADGTTQVTLGGKPLYYFAGDKAAGDINGQGFKNIWHLASATGDPVMGGATPATPAATTAAAATPAVSKCGGPACY